MAGAEPDRAGRPGTPGAADAGWPPTGMTVLANGGALPLAARGQVALIGRHADRDRRAWAAARPR